MPSLLSTAGVGAGLGGAGEIGVAFSVGVGAGASAVGVGAVRGIDNLTAAGAPVGVGVACGLKLSFGAEGAGLCGAEFNVSSLMVKGS